MRTFFVINAVVVAWCVATGISPWAKAAELPLHEAISSGKAKVTARAVGGSTGDTIEIAAQRQVPERLELTLVPGTVFTSSSGGSQNMVGARIRGERAGASTYRPSCVILLADNAEHRYVVEAYCLDFNKDNPAMGDGYQISAVDDRAGQILRAGSGLTNSTNKIEVIQSALWLDREHLTAAELKERFPVTDEDIAAAHRLLQQMHRLTQ